MQQRQTLRMMPVAIQKLRINDLDARFDNLDQEAQSEDKTANNVTSSVRSRASVDARGKLGVTGANDINAIAMKDQPKKVETSNNNQDIHLQSSTSSIALARQPETHEHEMFDFAAVSQATGKEAHVRNNC